MAGILDMLLGSTNPVSQFADTHRNWLSALGAGLGSGTNLNTGLAAAAQMAPQGANLDYQQNLVQQQRNQTAQYLKAQGFDDLVPLALGGDGATALQVALQRQQPGYGQQTYSPGDVIVDQKTGKTIRTIPRPPIPLSQFDTSILDPNTGNVTPLQGNGGDTIDSIVQGIESGKLPPATSGLSRPMAAAVQARLANDGFDLSTGALNFKGANSRISALNGVKQVALGQALDTTAKSLDIIDNLADQWAGLKLPGGANIPVLNKTNLAAAKQGLYGPQAMSIATQLDGQISDSAAEIGQVFKGGNSPTDKALEEAGTQLNSSWSTDTLHDMTNLIRQNMAKRRQSMNDSNQAVGVGGNNQYLPGNDSATAPIIKHLNGVDYTSPDGGQTWYQN